MVLDGALSGPLPINNNYYSAANSEAALLAQADSAAAKNSSITSIAVTLTCLSET